MIAIEKMNELGATDYYLDLKKYIDSYVNANYPLTKEDLRAVMYGNTTDNMSRANEAKRIMEEEAADIIVSVMQENERFLNELNNGGTVKPKTREDYEKEMSVYQQRLLQALSREKSNPSFIEESEQTARTL